jgi:hypothetical protein
VTETGRFGISFSLNCEQSAEITYLSVDIHSEYRTPERISREQQASPRLSRKPHLYIRYALPIEKNARRTDRQPLPVHIAKMRF